MAAVPAEAPPAPDPTPEVEPIVVPAQEPSLDTEAAEPELGNGPAPKRRGRKPGEPRIRIWEMEALIARGFSLGAISIGMGEDGNFASRLRAGAFKVTDEMRARLRTYAASVGVT